MKVKQRVTPVAVKKGPDFFTIIENTGSKHKIYFDDYNKITLILMKIDETYYKDYIIPAKVISERLCDVYHPEMKTKMLRPTGGYYKFYHSILRILDHYRYINYYKDGTILKNKMFVDITPIKRGISKWL